MALTTTVDLTQYKACYRKLLERLSAAVAAEDKAETKQINDECNALINCMVTEIREANNNE